MNKAVIKSERLELRSFHIDEAKRFYKLNSDTEVMKFTGDTPFCDILEAEKFISKYDHYDIHGFGRWSVYTIENQKWHGWCGLKRNEDGLVDLGFRFLRESWNKGYATEASSAVLEYAFRDLGLSSVIARCSHENKASQRVLEKLNMQFWKTEKYDGLGKTNYFIKTN